MPRDLLTYKERYQLTDEELGCDSEALRRAVAEREREAEERYRVPSPGWIAHARKHLTARLMEVRSGEPMFWSPMRSSSELLKHLQRDGLTPEDVGCTGEDLPVLHERWKELHCLYQAERYRQGDMSPSDLFSELDQHEVHHAKVGISSQEREFFTKQGS